MQHGRLIVLKQFSLAEHPVANDGPPLFLPDIGTFFNRDFELATRMLRQLKEAGVRVVKGEILQRVELCLNDEAIERYYSADGIIAERWRDLMARKVNDLDTYAQLFGLCHELGLPFVLSVYDREGADFAKSIGAAGLKIASGNLVHQPLIEHVAALRIPMLIDTGKASLEEIARAVQWARDAGADRIVIEHSPLAPPAPIEEHNLRMMATLRSAFDVPVGLSDHHFGDEMLFAAVALGVPVLEKGVCPDNAAADQDVHHALPIGKVAEVIGKCDRIHAALGSPMRYLRREAPKHNQRMGLIARNDLRAGDTLSLDTVDFAWPNVGIPVEQWGVVRGWRARVSVPRGTPIRWNDVQPQSS